MAEGVVLKGKETPPGSFLGNAALTYVDFDNMDICGPQNIFNDKIMD